MANDQLALLVAGGSLAVSLLAFLWTIGWSIWSHQQTHRPRLHIAANWSMPIVAGNFGPDCVGVSITNTGVMPVAINTLTLRVRADAQRRQLLSPEWMHTALPKPLGVGETWSAPLVPVASLRQALATQLPELTNWQLLVVVTDPTGREYSTEFDVTRNNEL